MRAAPVAIATAVAVVAAVGVGVAVASDTDEARQVASVGVGAVTVDDSATRAPAATGTASTATGPTTSPAPQQVQGLDQLQGVLTRDDSDDSDDSDDRAEFEVAGVDLDLGPDSWLLSTGPIADYDGDGTMRPVRVELEALLGQEVTVAGRYEVDDSDDSSGRGSDDDDLAVYEIQGMPFRDTAGGPAPWATSTATATDGRTDGPTDDASTDGAAPAPGLSREEIGGIAVDAVGADSRVSSIDTEDDGGASWEVEVEDASGVEQRVLLDGAGTVLDIRPED